MSLKTIVEKSKVDRLDVVTTSIQIPRNLKEQLQKVCKENEITVNSFMVNLIDDILNGDLKDKTTLEIVEKLSELIEKRDKLNKIQARDMERFITLDGVEIDLEDAINETEFMIRVLKRGAK